MRERSCTHTHTNIACACCKAVPPATRLPMPDQGMQIHPLFWSTRRRSRHTRATRPQADGYPSAAVTCAGMLAAAVPPVRMLPRRVYRLPKPENWPCAGDFAGAPKIGVADGANAGAPNAERCA
jgi:hypothetical protein